MAHSRDFMVGVLVGGAIGAAAALLYAPQSGPETRDLIKERAVEAKDKTGELATQVRERASTIANQAQSRVGEITTQVKTRADEVGHQAHEIIDRGREVIDRQKEAVIAAVDAGRQAYQEKQTTLQQDVAEDTQPAAADGGATPPAPPTSPA
jgi:gas vesicle protein